MGLVTNRDRPYLPNRKRDPDGLQSEERVGVDFYVIILYHPLPQLPNYPEPTPVFLFDNSSLSDWRDRAPRYWYFKHYRGWQPEPQQDQAFLIHPTVAGNAWHAMMDVYWPNPSAGWEPAWARFERYWKEHMLAGGLPIHDLDPEFEKQLGAYAPAAMQATLIAYDEARRPLLNQIELLDCERPFVVPLDPHDPTLFYTGRKDKRFRHQNKIKLADHKTTTLYYSRPIGRPHLRPYWIQGWHVDLQPRGYLHAEKLEHNLDRCSIWIDGVLLHPDSFDQCLESIECGPAMLDAWLWSTHFQIKQLREHIQAVEELRNKDQAKDLPYLPAFPCYGCKGACAYRDLCLSKPNPEEWLPSEPPPEGYVEQRWAPFDVERVTKVLQEQVA